MKLKEPENEFICEGDELRHQGTITNLDDQNYYVSIVSKSACSACHSKGFCSVSEMQEKVIIISRSPDSNYKIGDEVEVLMSKTMGTKAVILGYIIPFALLLITLILTFSLIGNEGVAGIMSLAIVAIYFVVLYLFRDRFRKTFRFTIR